MSMRHFAFVLLLAAPWLPAAADNHILYECIDQSGNKRFTNISAEAKGCKVLSTGQAAPVAPAAAPAKAHTRSPPIATPSNFPRVDRELQRQRDNDRQRILEQELGAEQKLLDQAKKELSEQEAVRLGSERNYQRVLDRLEPFQKRVKLHEDNIANLRKELSKVR